MRPEHIADLCSAFIPPRRSVARSIPRGVVRHARSPPRSPGVIERIAFA